MRTESVNSRLMDILKKLENAKQHLDEAMSELPSLPEAEAREARGLIEPLRNQFVAGMHEYRAWAETPSKG
jgi:hypothetical protein